MKRLITIGAYFLLYSQFSFGQITKIKQQLKQVFFELDIPSTKYDVRKMLHSSDNFFDLSESTLGDYDMMDATFTNNLKLSYISNATRRLIQFWYYKGTDNIHSFSYDIHYKTKYVENCSQQSKELINPLAELISKCMLTLPTGLWFINLFKNCKTVSPATFANILDLKPVKDLA